MNRPDDHEAKMARADLFKLAQYSFKLFKMIQEDQELEGWVQAKITKAADYIASVYHYLEYEMKISEYGDHIENSEMYSESIRRVYVQKLEEAVKTAKKLKAVAQKDLDEAFDDKAKTGDTKKTATGTLTKTSTGVVHKNTSYADDGDAEDKSGKGKKSHAKSQSAAEKKSQAPKQKQSPKSAKTWGMKDSEKFDNRDKSVAEGAKPDFLDMDKDGNKKEPMKKAVADKKKNPFVKEGTCSVCKKNPCTCNIKEGMAPMDPDGATAPPPKGKDGQYPIVTSGPHKGKRWSPKTPGPTNPTFKEAAAKCNHTAKGKSCPVHGLKECGGMYEGDKFDPLKHVKNPTKGEKDAAKDVKRGSYADRAAMLKSAEADGRLKKESTGDYSAKKAAAGKDIGKPGKNFSKIEKSAGGGDKGKQIAGAVLAKLRAKG